MTTKKAIKKIRNYLILAFGFILTFFVTVLLFNVTDYGITIAAFAASIFMIITKKRVSHKKIFGSYLVAIALGYLFSQIPTWTSFNVALTAISSIVAMSMLKFEHAPAIGIGVATVLNQFSFWTDVIVALCLFFILGMAILIKNFFANPEKVLNFIKIENEKVDWNNSFDSVY